MGLFMATSPNVDQSLIAYAFLAQTTRNSGDLLSGLVPIFKPIAKKYSGNAFDPGLFSSELGEIYGLDVNTKAVEDFIPRLEAAGVITNIGKDKEYPQYVYSEIKEQFDEVSPVEIREAVKEFISFSSPLLQEHGVEVDSGRLEEVFLQQLVDMDFVGVLLKPERKMEKEGGKKTLSIPPSQEQKEWEDDKRKRSQEEILCATFIVDAYHNRPKLYELIMKVASGALIAQVVLNFQDPGTSFSLDGLTVVLDTPFLMDLLDLASKEGHEAAKRIVDQLVSGGAKLSVFDHSIDELKSNLNAVISRYHEGEAFGATARRLAEKSFESYATSIMRLPESPLRSRGISIISCPNSTHSYQYFSEEHKEQFNNSLGYFANRWAQERDAESVAGIVRLRNGKVAKMGRFPSSGYVLLTDNAWVMTQSEKFMIQKKYYEKGDFPPAVTDRYLSGLLWVVLGGKTADLPKYVLLANCAAALEPKSDVVSHMYRFLSQLDDEKAQHFHALMTDERASQHLMELTLGEAQVVTQSNAPEILEKLKSKLLEQHEKQTEIALKEKELELGEEHEKKLKDELEKQANDYENQLTEEQRRVKESEEELDQVRTMLSLQKKDFDWKINSMSEDLTRLEEENTKHQDLEREREYGVVKGAVIVANKQKRRLELLIAFVVAIIAILVTFSPIFKEHVLLKAIIGGAIVLLSFWKVPEVLFGKLTCSYREGAFRDRMMQAGILDYPEKYNINWETEDVLLKDGYPVIQNSRTD